MADGLGSGKGTSESSKKNIIQAKDMPASRGSKKEPVIKRETSPVTAANKEDQEKKA